MNDVKIYELDHQGRGIGKINNKIIFVKNALPNELVRVKIIKNYSKYCEGEIINIIKKDLSRVKVKCPYYLNCGGCQLLHMNYKHQLKFKNDKIKNIITKCFKEKIKINDIIPTNQYNYRNKATFKINNKELGFFKEKTHDFIKINHCLLLDKKINDAISKINKNSLNELTIRSSLYENKIITKKEEFIFEKIDNLLFKISLDSFFQINTVGSIILYKKILEYADLKGNEKILDLYCGTGTIGIYLSKYAKEVIGIEINENSVNDANHNKKLNNIKNIKFICADVKNIDKSIKSDIIIIDPPRSGLNKKIIDKIINFNPKIIIYVSCNPMTLARDLGYLIEKYKALEITPIDMFPNTSHVECVAKLERK